MLINLEMCGQDICDALDNVLQTTKKNHHFLWQ